MNKSNLARRRANLIFVAVVALVVRTASADLLITNITMTGGNVNLSGSGGLDGQPCLVQTSTNLALAVSNWPVIATNSFDIGGKFAVSVPQPPGVTGAFFRVRSGTNDPFRMMGWATMGNGTTGGAGGPTQTVSTVAAFRSALNARTPQVVMVQGTIDLGGETANIRSDKTIIGLGTNATILGHLAINGPGYTNAIIRNLTLVNPVSGEDAVTLQDSVENVWIDHCNLGDAGDGQLDIDHGSDYITVSWCKFSYTNVANPHRLSSLVGHSPDNAAEDTGHLRVTYHHNWWSTNCLERMPRVRFGQVHVFNNYFNAPGNNYCVRAGYLSQLNVENNYFDQINSPFQYFSEVTSGGITNQGLIKATGNVTVNCTSVTSFNDAVFTPPYPYALDPGNSVKTNILNHAGVGRGPFAPK
jgi:pectate lyase